MAPWQARPQVQIPVLKKQFSPYLLSLKYFSKRGVEKGLKGDRKEVERGFTALREQKGNIKCKICFDASQTNLNK